MAYLDEKKLNRLTFVAYLYYVRKVNIYVISDLTGLSIYAIKQVVKTNNGAITLQSKINFT